MSWSISLQNVLLPEDSQADGNDANQAPETEGPNTDVAVLGVRAGKSGAS